MFVVRRWYQYSSSFCAALAARDAATDADLVRSEYEIFEDL